ncbi:MAG: hypothetical protein HeimC3_13110 [Candidatus Heimdallarchaeota archaeon LC_3]|nr:MAG: hypothetical protein HeimC3_13110 [Candidatus Heimdallarchaeota archaeon LC_3]
MSKAKKTTTKNEEPKKVATEEKASEIKKIPSKDKVSTKLKEITSSRRLKLEKKPIPKSLVNNEGIKYYFYFLYVFILLALLNAINTNLFNIQSLLDLNGPIYDSTNNPLIPKDLLDLFMLNFYSFFMAILALLLRVFVATGLAVLAFDDEKDSWIRLVSVVGIVFIIFGVQIIGP